MNENDVNLGNNSIDYKNNETINNFSNSNQEESLIAKINKNEDGNINQNTINLENFKIEEIEKGDGKKINFENINIDSKEKKHYHINYRKTFILSFSTIVLATLISLGLFAYKSYIGNYRSSATIEQENNMINILHKLKDLINKYSNKNHNISNNINLYGANAKENLDTIINTKNLNYIQKKEILKPSVEELMNVILKNHEVLEDTKKSISKIGFLPSQISNIISDDEQISSIQNSLVSLEAIKFNSAINVFSHLDTFLEGLSNTSKISKKQIEENIKNIMQRGEKDVNLYIKNCYLNPFETNYDCKTIGDFDIYYLQTKDIYFDTDFFKQLVRYVDIKLEQTELPSFSINFKKFDKNSNQITFNIDINTFKQDELELAKKGILGPHIFILNSLINNLRQSRFILGKGIVIRTLNIEPKTINIGTTEFNINNSNKTFTVDIQKESEREIDDFVDININNLYK